MSNWRAASARELFCGAHSETNLCTIRTAFQSREGMSGKKVRNAIPTLTLFVRPRRSPMKRFAGSMLALLAVGMSGMAVGQDKPMGEMPPKVLTIMREYTKPGKAGSQHEKSESLFVQAVTRAKWPTHYLAVESVSGKSRALFLTGYDS